MNKKQKKIVAEMWASQILMSVGMDSFDNQISYEDAGEIVEMIFNMGAKLSKKYPVKYDLSEIINYALKQTNNGTTE